MSFAGGTLRWFLLSALALGGIARASAAPAPPAVRLAASGKALMPVVVAADASERVRAAAMVLAGMLSRLSGARFEVTTGDGRAGLAVGLPGSFPALSLRGRWDPADPTLAEDYLLRSHAGGVYLIGATEQAVEHAVWDCLYRLGYRQFFPGKTWEIVPKQAGLSLSVETLEHPSFYARRIWYGFGTWDYNAQPYAEWCARNRATSGITLNTGHAYDGILAANRAAFQAHPEYLALVGGERKGSKLCISNPGLRKLVVEYALAHFEKNPDDPSISLEPSDGGGWCECDACKAMGSVSDRALTLANEVAAAVRARFGPKYVGLYAYSQHSPPPGVRVGPGVVVSIATAFITGGFSVDQLLDGWSRQGAVLGIREYYSVNTWDRDLPGQARGGSPAYLAESLPRFYRSGARFLSAEASDNWGPNGLGYYLAARMLWDVREAEHLDALKADFLEKAFGPARAPMGEFYALIDGAKKPLLCDDLLGRMYGALERAAKAAPEEAVRARVDDLVLYTRYVELFAAYQSARGPARQAAFEALIRHAYRMRRAMMVHTRALYRDLAARDKSVTIPAECAWNVPEGKNPWKSSEPFSRAELDGFVAAGIARYPLRDFEPVSFSEELVPAAALKLPQGAPGSMGLYSRGERVYYTWVERAPASITLKARAGLVYQNRGDARLQFFAGDGQTPVDRAAVPADRQEHEVVLKTAVAGLHRLVVSDAGAGTSVAWPEGMPMTVRSGADAPASLLGRWSLCFYVPKGTKVVGGYAGGPGALVDGSGQVLHTFEGRPGYYRVPVPPGRDGALWQLRNCAGEQRLLTVPPYLARSGAELLLPRSVVSDR